VSLTYALFVKAVRNKLTERFECLKAILLKIQTFRDISLCCWVSSSTVFGLTDTGWRNYGSVQNRELLDRSDSIYNPEDLKLDVQEEMWAFLWYDAA